MGRTCGTYGGEKHAWFLWENLEERDQLKNVGVHGRIILKCTSFLKKRMEWDWIHLIQSTEKWRAVVSKVTNMRVPLNVRDFLNQLRNKKFLKNPYFIELVSCLVM
jgi:hypothetical protein